MTDHNGRGVPIDFAPGSSSDRGAERAVLRGVHLKLRRGREKRLEVRRLSDVNAPLMAVTAREDPNTREQCWVIDGAPTAPEPSLSVHIGECLYNFRSALDHLAWVLDEKPGKHTMFPLARCQKEFNLKRIATMPDEVVAKVANWQPYYLAGHRRYRAEMLGGLETLINIDKHRHLNMVAAAAGDAYGWSPGGVPSYQHHGPIEDGTVLARFHHGSRQSEFRVVPGLWFEGLPEMKYLKGSVDKVLFGIDGVVCKLVNEFRSAFLPHEHAYPEPGI